MLSSSEAQAAQSCQLCITFSLPHRRSHRPFPSSYRPNLQKLWYCRRTTSCSEIMRGLVPTMVALAGTKPRHELRVQPVHHGGGQRSYLVVDFTRGSVHNRADNFLSLFCEGT